MGFYKKLLKQIANFEVKHPFFVVFFILALTMMVFSFAPNVRTVASLEKMLPYDLEEVKAFNLLRDNNLGQDGIAVIIEVENNQYAQDNSYLVNFNEETNNLQIREDIYTYLKNLDAEFSSTSGILDAVSVVDYLDKGLDFKSEHITGFFNDDYSQTMIFIKTDISTNDLNMNLLSDNIKEDLENIGKPDGVKTSLTGTPVVQQKLGKLINLDRQSTKWISTLLVFLVISIIFRSVVAAIIPVIIVTVSIDWLNGVMGYYDMPISTLAGGVAAMVIGIGIDYSLFLMNRFKFNRQKGKSIKEAMEISVVSAGSSLTATSATTMAAFIAFMFGSMPEMNRFGMLMVIGVFFSFLFSILLLPALLVIEEKIYYYLRTKKVAFGPEDDLVLEKRKKPKKKGRYKHHKDDIVFWGDEQ